MLFGLAQAAPFNLGNENEPGGELFHGYQAER